MIEALTKAEAQSIFACLILAISLFILAYSVIFHQNETSLGALISFASSVVGYYFGMKAAE